MRKGFLVGWVLPALLLLGVGVLGAIRSDHPGGDIPWTTDFQSAGRQAQQTHRPMLLSFHTPGCVWCDKMDAETFTDSKVVALSRHYICVRLESDVDGAVCSRYRIFDYPTTLILDSQGHEQARLSGYIPPERFATALSGGW
jgi:thiol:disulfide interchange protein DsbD